MSHAQYLAFVECARSVWLRCLGIDQQALLASDGNGFLLRHIDIDFIHAAALSAALEITSKVLKTVGASVKLRQTTTIVQSCHIVARLVADIEFFNLLIDRLGAGMPYAKLYKAQTGWWVANVEQNWAAQICRHNMTVGVRTEV